MFSTVLTRSKAIGLIFLDTPMSGNITGAIKSTPNFTIGGFAEEFVLSKAVLKGMGAKLLPMWWLWCW